jgi:putative ABC transport system permease protein
MNGDGSGQPGQVVTIVGIVPDVRQETLDKPPLMQIYSPFWQKDFDSASIIVRSAITPVSMADQIRSVLRAIDPALALASVRTMDDLVSTSKAGRRFQTSLLSVLAGIALFLSLLGLYALLAYSVKQRTAEIGVRMALGAQRSAVLRMILRQGLLLASAGIIIGLVASLALTRLLRGLLFEVAPNDSATLLGVTLLLLAVALTASVIPARRAMRVDPIVALRYE